LTSPGPDHGKPITTIIAIVGFLFVVLLVVAVVVFLVVIAVLAMMVLIVPNTLLDLETGVLTLLKRALAEKANATVLCMNCRTKT
jgi:hypothetical protein